MKKKIIIITSIILGVLVLLAAGVFVFAKYANQNQEFKKSINKAFGPKVDESLPVLKNIGINLKPYDPATGMAGDVKFEKIKSQYWQEIMFEHYGYKWKPNENNPNPGLNNHPEYFLPAGTKIFAVSDGIVQDVKKIYSDDYSVLVTKQENSQWIINYEHVWNPVVKKGQVVKTGDPIAEVSTLQTKYSTGEAYGLWALAIFKGARDGEKIQNYCPYLLFDPSVKSEMQAKLAQLVTDWEKFMGKNIYDEENWVAPGCALETMTEK